MGQWHILTTEHPNTKGFAILNNGVDWSLYLCNPILLVEHRWGSKPIGRVTDIRLCGNAWIGRLEFFGDVRSERYRKKYENGELASVSIGGVIRRWDDTGEKEIRTAASFQVFEVSLVKEPSNPEAVKTSL